MKEVSKRNSSAGYDLKFETQRHGVLEKMEMWRKEFSMEEERMAYI